MLLRIMAWAFDTVPSVKTTLILAGIGFVGLIIIGIGMGIAGVDAHGPNDPPVQITVGDTSCDGDVGVMDSLAILRYDAQLPPFTTCMNIGDTYQLVPPCLEDELVVGIGNFESTGYWDEYICQHPDVIFYGE